MKQEKDLERILPFLKKIDSKRREQFEAYFRTAPDWLMESFSIENMEKGEILVREGAPVDTVFLIGSGVIKATDYRIYGIPFDFMLFSNVYAYGGMEVLMNLDEYRTTLQTVSNCTVVKIPSVQFRRWMQTDIEALQQEARLMGEYLLEQARNSRAFLFLQGADRLAFLMISRYEKYAVDGILRLKENRQELADCTGLSVKTITRSVQKFVEQGLIHKDKRMIVIERTQYEKLKERISEILSED